jgi:hypothetical protein
VTKVEHFEAIRRDHYVYGKSIREIARRRHVHRRVVRQALSSSVPPARKRPTRPCPVLTPAFQGVIDEWLVADRDAPRKQRHTGVRIFDRLVREHGFTGAASTVRRHVGRRRRELGLKTEAFVPQTRTPGREAEVDWYEADVDFPSGRRRVFFFAFRACWSGREFHIAFPRMTQQAFLEGFVAALLWFGGVFSVVRMDNLGSAVRRVLQGRRRLETARFVALRSHYLFESEYCLPGLKGAHEKGGVEGGLGRFRRHHLVPVPQVADFAELNRRLRDACAEDDLRTIEGRGRTILENWNEEQGLLQPLPSEPFDCSEVAECRVDSKSRVRVRRNFYSVPVRLVGRKVEVRIDAGRIRAVHEGRTVADHERLHGASEQSLVLDHYLELLRHKPGALRQATPLRQARDRREWPDAYDRLWVELCNRHGERDGTRQLLDVLLMHRSSAHDDVHTAVEMALELGCIDSSAIGVLLRQVLVPDEPVAPLAGLGLLAEIGVPANDDLGIYDLLLAGIAE